MGAVSAARVVGVVGLFADIHIENGSCLALDVFLNVFGAIPKHFDARLAVFIQEAHVFELKTLVDDAHDDSFSGEGSVEIIFLVHAVHAGGSACLLEKRAQTL